MPRLNLFEILSGRRPVGRHATKLANAVRATDVGFIRSKLNKTSGHGLEHQDYIDFCTYYPEVADRIIARAKERISFFKKD